jgi:hypothetical protein
VAIISTVPRSCNSTGSALNASTFVGTAGNEGLNLGIFLNYGDAMRGEVVVASVPFKWQSGSWTQLRLALRKTDAGFRLEGSAWADGSPVPKEPSITFVESKPQPAGKASVWGLPFSGTPLRFDDLGVTRVGG